MNFDSNPKKSLGQHWLNDVEILHQIADYAEINKADTIIEVGPGLGTLTEVLLSFGGKITAVEYDKELYEQLKRESKNIFSSDISRLTLVNQDILKFRFDQIVEPYKIVANIPYYLTSNLIRLLSELNNPPKKVVLLIQKEVALRLCAHPGTMSLLSVWAQSYFDCKLGVEVPARYFTPPPKVDSQVVILDLLAVPKIEKPDLPFFKKILASAYNSKRKTLQNTLAVGLSMDKSRIKILLDECKLPANSRPQELSVEDWIHLVQLSRQKSS